MRSILLAAALVCACGGEQSKPADPGPQPSVETPPAAEPVEREIDAGAVAPAASANETCVQECVASRQMQATSIEQIEMDCQARCANGDSAPSIGQ